MIIELAARLISCKSFPGLTTADRARYTVDEIIAAVPHFGPGFGEMSDTDEAYSTHFESRYASFFWTDAS
jgi:hypothetical protein